MVTTVENLPRCICVAHDCPSSGAVMAAGGEVEAGGSPHKRWQSEDSVDATTAHSTWVEDETSELSSTSESSRGGDSGYAAAGSDDDSLISYPPTVLSPSFSSLGSSRFLDEGADNDASSTANWSLPRSVSSCSSYYSAVAQELSESVGSCTPLDAHPAAVDSHSVTQCRCRQASNASSCIAKDELLSELTERAHLMLRIEQSAEYNIDNYFHQVDPTSLPTSEVTPHSHSHIDASCRSKMMEWSFRVLEASFPHCPSDKQHSRRKYSLEAIQIASQAFNFIDRVSTHHFQGNFGRPMDRSQYKLICMVCLHLAAKTCGLFSVYADEKDYEVVPNCHQSPPKKEVWLVRESTVSLSYSVSTNEGPCPEEGITILPTPTISSCVNEPSQNGQALRNHVFSEGKDTKHPRPTDRPTARARPPLVFLSLAGLTTLCHEEFPLKQMINVECQVLQRLDWKLTCPTSVDWCHLLLDIFLAHTSAYHEGKDGQQFELMGRIDIQLVWDVALSNLEYAIEVHVTAAPSLVAWAAVSHALDEYGKCRHKKQVIPHYKKMIAAIVPHGEEDFNAVYFSFWR